jgi:hypothetical protein
MLPSYGGRMAANRKLVSSESEFELAVGYSRAVQVGPYVAVAGTTGSGPAGDIAAQAEDALRRIEIALQQGGRFADRRDPHPHLRDRYFTVARGRSGACPGLWTDTSRGDHGRGFGADRTRAAGRDRSRRLRGVARRALRTCDRRKCSPGTRQINGDRFHSGDRQRPVQVREQHRRRIRWHTGFPAHRRVQQSWVDVQQDQVLATAEEPVGRQMNLLRRRQMDELSSTARAGRRGVDRPAIAGTRPLVDPAQMHQYAGS